MIVKLCVVGLLPSPESVSTVGDVGVVVVVGGGRVVVVVWVVVVTRTVVVVGLPWPPGDEVEVEPGDEVVVAPPAAWLWVAWVVVVFAWWWPTTTTGW